ncbi:hypothetical protein RJ641_021179 [Dillenia turbinata]|uniref:Uncharacterized protein n=1 Tax=Dillenia turbinata TaxID=194707 RepID=A0AAN8UNL1_9MAGN
MTSTTVAFFSLSRITQKTLISPNPKSKPRCTNSNLKPSRHISKYKTHTPTHFIVIKSLSTKFRCSAADNSEGPTWSKWIPGRFVAVDKVLRLIDGATLSPIGQYISFPPTSLHSVDRRIKLVSLSLSLVLSWSLLNLRIWFWCKGVMRRLKGKLNGFNILSHGKAFKQIERKIGVWLLALVFSASKITHHYALWPGSTLGSSVSMDSPQRDVDGYVEYALVAASMKTMWLEASVPSHFNREKEIELLHPLFCYFFFQDQWGEFHCFQDFLFILSRLTADGAPPLVQSRTLPPAKMGLPNVRTSLNGYSYLIMKLGPLQLTRKGLSLASTSACLTFTIAFGAIYVLIDTLESNSLVVGYLHLDKSHLGASLCLATTTPEQLASALQWSLRPLSLVGAPLAEIILTLLLSLRVYQHCV